MKGNLFYIDIKNHYLAKDPNEYISYTLEQISQKEFDLKNC